MTMVSLKGTENPGVQMIHGRSTLIDLCVPHVYMIPCRMYDVHVSQPCSGLSGSRLGSVARSSGSCSHLTTQAVALRGASASLS